MGYFARPSGNHVVPCVVYYHGGAMASGSAFAPEYKTLARVLAHEGIAVVVVDFRNYAVPSAAAPGTDRLRANRKTAQFPGGLNDCYSGLQWVHAHADELRVDPAQIAVCGESGGGNLCLAVTLKCLKMGTTYLLPRGVFSLCPYIAGVWPQHVQNNGILGTSHLDTENNGIFLTLSSGMDAPKGYGIEAFDRRDPLAWPGFATVDDLRGFPRSVICVNECDPLRDEGINFYRRLLAAGADSRCRCAIGTQHGAELMFPVVPDIAMDNVRYIAHFVRGQDTTLLSSTRPGGGRSRL